MTQHDAVSTHRQTRVLYKQKKTKHRSKVGYKTAIRPIVRCFKNCEWRDVMLIALKSKQAQNEHGQIHKNARFQSVTRYMADQKCNTQC